MPKPSISAVGFDFYGVIYQYSQDDTLGVLNLVRQLREAGYRVGVLSNTNSQDKHEIKSLAHYFDAIVASGEVGRHKPDAAPYLELARQLGSEPMNTVFVDDTPTHVVGAKVAGLQGIVYRDRNQLTRDLRNLGIQI